MIRTDRQRQGVLRSRQAATFIGYEYNCASAAFNAYLRGMGLSFFQILKQ